jgi:hypothetical protein
MNLLKPFDAWKARIAERERQKEADKKALKELFTKHIPQAWNQPVDKPVGKPRIVTCPQGIVTYQMAPKTVGGIVGSLFSTLSQLENGDIKQAHPVDEKIRQMLAANPNCRITDYEDVLDIKVIRQERGKSSSSGIIIDPND